MKKLSCFLISTLFLLSAIEAFGQCNWTGRAILNETTSAQPGLAPFNVGGQDRLFLAWAGTDGNRTVNVMSSADGFNYTNKVILAQMQSRHGVGLVGSPGCSSLYLAFSGRDASANLNLARSFDGINWSGPFSFSCFFAPCTSSTPVLIGNPAPVFGGNIAAGFRAGADSLDLSTFPCDLSSGTDGCFYFIPGTGFCADERSVGAPAWANTAGIDIKASARPNMDHIVFQLNMGQGDALFNEWSDDGPSATINPATGTVYIAWRGGNDGRINIINLSTRQKLICTDWSPNTPVLAVFGGRLFVAWRGGDNKINIGSLNFF